MSKSWFADITVLGARSDPKLAERLATLSEKELAETIEIALAETELKGPAHRFTGEGRSIRDRLPWAYTSHAIGYIPSTGTARRLVEILPAEALEPDQDLLGQRINLGLDGFQPYRYPGGTEDSDGRLHRVLFHFGARHFPGEEERLHFNVSHRVKEREPFRFLSQPVFAGLTAGDPGLDLSFLTLPLYDPCDVSFFEALSTVTARRGLQLSEHPQPAADLFSEQAFRTTERVLSNMDPVAETYLGLGFHPDGQGVPLRTGTYVVAQISGVDELLFEDDGWQNWLFSLRTGQIIDRQDPRQLFPYNYVLLTVDQFAPRVNQRRSVRAIGAGSTLSSPALHEAKLTQTDDRAASRDDIQTPVALDANKAIVDQVVPESTPHERQRKTEQRADLTIRVYVERRDGKSCLVYELESGIAELDFPRVQLPGPEFEVPPEEYRNSMLATISDLGRGVFKDELYMKRDVEERLVSLGRNLYAELFPKDMRKAYRWFRDKIRSLQIISSEPWIPWEMIKPYDTEGETIVDDDFLCWRYELTRWHFVESDPPNEIPVGQLAAVHAGEVAGLEPLRKADDEYAVLTRLPIDYPAIIDRSLEGKRARRDDLVQLLEAGGLNLLHIIAHGDFDSESPSEAGFYLQDRRRLLSADIVGPIASEIAKSRPLIFMNSCLSGQQSFSLTGLGGWASAFIKAGCGAFLGPQWAVSDSSAYELVNLFYSALKAEHTVGSAVQRARTQLVEKDTKSALLASLGLVVYAHPNGRVLFPSPAAPESDRVP